MRCAIFGPAGSLGSDICLELLNGGHEVMGVSRSPERLGSHERYRPIAFDLSTNDIAGLVDILKDVNVVVNAYNPPMDGNIYSIHPFVFSWTATETDSKLAETYLESTRCIIKAIKQLTTDVYGPYLIQVGGTGSLETLGRNSATALDSRRWWLTLRRTVAHSAAATAHMVEQLGGSGPLAMSFEQYRHARLAVEAGKDTQLDRSTVEEVEDAIL